MSRQKHRDRLKGIPKTQDISQKSNFSTTITTPHPNAFSLSDSHKSNGIADRIYRFNLSHPRNSDLLQEKYAAMRSPEENPFVFFRVNSWLPLFAEGKKRPRSGAFTLYHR